MKSNDLLLRCTTFEPHPHEVGWSLVPLSPNGAHKEVAPSLDLKSKQNPKELYVLSVDVLDGVFILFKGFILGHCLAPHVTVVPMMPSKRKAGCR